MLGVHPFQWHYAPWSLRVGLAWRALLAKCGWRRNWPPGDRPGHMMFTQGPDTSYVEAGRLVWIPGRRTTLLCIEGERKNLWGRWVPSVWVDKATGRICSPRG